MSIVLHLGNPVSDSSFLPRLGGALRQYLPPPWHPMAPVDGWMTSYGWMVDGWMMLNDVGMNWYPKSSGCFFHGHLSQISHQKHQGSATSVAHGVVQHPREAGRGRVGSGRYREVPNIFCTHWNDIKGSSFFHSELWVEFFQASK